MESLGPAGHIQHENRQLPLRVRRFQQMAGPVCQLLFAPSSIKDSYLQYPLFAESHFNERSYFRTAQAGLARVGWGDDLNDAYESIAADPKVAIPTIRELSVIETDVHGFLNSEVIKEAVKELATLLRDMGALDDTAVAMLNSRHAEFRPYVSVRILGALGNDTSTQTD